MIKSLKCRKEFLHILWLMSLFFIFSLTSFAQTHYEDYSTSEIIFLDEFFNNKNGWHTGVPADSSYSSKIENGYFEITSTCKGTNPLYSIKQTIDITRDFEIEAAILYVQGESNSAINLVWGKDDNNYRFDFGMSGNGQYIISQYNGSWINLKDWTISDLIHKSDYNKLTVRKIGTQYYFFLNEQLVHTSDFYPFFGNQIGFQDNQNTIIKINYLKVSYLKPNTNSNFSRLSQKEETQSTICSGFGGSLGLGYIHSAGETKDLWKDGFDIDFLLGYWFLPNFGFECGANVGLTGISEDKKVTVNVVDNYGNSSTRTTRGGEYCSFPIGLKYTCRVFSISNLFLTISGGGDYFFEDEWGMDDVTDYTSRGSSGFGYYARISFTLLEDMDSGFNWGWGLQIKYINNHANVSDFYKNSGFNTGDLVNKSFASDERLVILLEFCWL